ncbi:uncharacterized protein PITG_01685 [Phytophthora infestans T30-4]|uniref:Uncharacterized protein n=1 Tax=Phytophthora infestans (strain T30-4) TaxID=403677 RepID=D0MTU2_PHYIT|nr:uncharacterized protein PITG_01685 [Phytophthora infestans T30-4]EEY61389.1 conserved hypothetical protein [Phytophthora infestans T30-4]|eukprot:XP_002908306.1 conserved hypothetical protein [Phytophthora infestans T30-4]
MVQLATFGAAQSLENLATSSFMTATNSIGDTKLAFDVMGGSANLQAVSKPQVYVASAGDVAAGSPFYVAHYLACIKLRDISDYFKKCPMQKNTRGFIYLNYNSSSTMDTLITTGTAGVVAPTTIAMVQRQLLWPKKTFRYFERITNKFTVAPGASFTWTVSNGIANPKRLIMQPVITNITAGATVSDMINPFRSPFSTVPATTSPFAALKNLQITVGNHPIWNNPVRFGYDLFVQEMSKSGCDGGLDDVVSAGLLSQRQWELLYRFVAVDIGCRLPSEDGASKSIIVSGTSNCNYALTIYYHVLREVVVTVDTAMGTVSQGPTKQKAYDRYYNAMAKSDFAQGKKPKALIQNESLDDASADSLANLFQQVMAKNRPKGPPEIIKGEAHEAPKASKKKHTYVPQSTDADFDMEEPTAPEESPDDFYSGIHDVAQKATNTRAYIKGKKTLKQVVDDHVRNYLNKRRELRREDSMRS